MKTLCGTSDVSTAHTGVPFEFFNLKGAFFNLIWKLNGVPGVPFGTRLSGEYRTIQKDCWERRQLLRTHSPGMCYVSEQEGGQLSSLEASSEDTGGQDAAVLVTV